MTECRCPQEHIICSCGLSCSVAPRLGRGGNVGRAARVSMEISRWDHGVGGADPLNSPPVPLVASRGNTHRRVTGLSTRMTVCMLRSRDAEPVK
jgi:hypothetical protein